MSDTQSDAGRDSSTFGIPDHHFLQLVLDLLKGLELQTRERGHGSLASLIEIAKTEAAAGLARLSKTTEPPVETKLLRLVNVIRTHASPAAAKESGRKRP